jgi:hypothetical protein
LEFLVFANSEKIDQNTENLKELKNYILLLQIEKKMIKIWQSSPNPENHKIGQNWKFWFIIANSGKFDPKLEKFAKLSKPQTLKGLENYIFLLQIWKFLTKD